MILTMFQWVFWAVRAPLWASGHQGASAGSMCVSCVPTGPALEVGANHPHRHTKDSLSWMCFLTSIYTCSHRFHSENNTKEPCGQSMLITFLSFVIISNKKYRVKKGSWCGIYFRFLTAFVPQRLNVAN